MSEQPMELDQSIRQTQWKRNQSIKSCNDRNKMWKWYKNVNMLHTEKNGLSGQQNTKNTTTSTEQTT